MTAVAPYWPRLLRQSKAAQYCDMTTQAFEKAVASGELPMPKLVAGNERWDRVEIDKMLDGNQDDWRSRQPFYAS